MPGRSHARYLAPLALIVFLLALVMVVSTSGESGTGEEEEAATPSERTEDTASREGEGDAEGESRRSSGPRTYRVRAGDTPSTIAEKTGVPLDQLEELNPDIDPQQLSPGQRLRLRR